MSETLTLTWRDLFVEVANTAGVHGPWSNDEIDWVLWERTSFPLGSVGEVRAHLWQYFVLLVLGHDGCEMCGTDLTLVDHDLGVCVRCWPTVGPEEDNDA